MKPRPKAEDKSQHGSGKLWGKVAIITGVRDLKLAPFPNSLVVSRSGFTYVADPSVPLADLR